MDEKVPWLVKEQTVMDKNTGATIKFGSYGASSSLIYLQLHVPGKDESEIGRGVTIQFNRHTGECHGFLPHNIDDADQGKLFAAPSPPPEPYQPNPQAKVIGATPGAAGAAPGTAVEGLPATDPPPSVHLWPPHTSAHILDKALDGKLP